VAQNGRVDMVETLSALQSLLLTTQDLEDFFHELAGLTADIVEPPASVGITMRGPDGPYTVATSDERAAQVDEQQYSNGAGPCIQALSSGEIVEVTDQEHDDRWGGYAPRARKHGVKCVLSLPLSAGDGTAGAINIYGYERPGAFTGPQRSAAEVFAAQASTAMALLLRQAHQNELCAQLEQALTSRTVIDQAIGVIMGQQGCNRRRGVRPAARALAEHQPKAAYGRRRADRATDRSTAERAASLPAGEGKEPHRELSGAAGGFHPDVTL